MSLARQFGPITRIRNVMNIFTVNPAKNYIRNSGHRPGMRKRAWIVVTAIAMAVAISHPSQAKMAPESFADLAEKLLPSVVNVSTTQVVEGIAGVEIPRIPPGSPFNDFFKNFMDRNHQQNKRKRKAISLGSGFIIDSKGYVVTNNHVIKDADEITVILQDNTRLKAKLVGHDPKTDLAVLKVDPKGHKFPAVKFGDSGKARVGDWVVAIGNPFGLGGTVTTGIISARNRDINSGPYDDFFQTDASINRGNSGGPMFNLDGNVIGINTAIFSPSGGSVGIGFAISSAVASPVIKQLIAHGKVRRGWLGVHIQAVNDAIAETLGMSSATGALVASVMAGGPAEKSKIKTGDVILEFDGKKVDKMRSLPRIVAETDVDKTVNVLVWRNGHKKSIKVRIGEMKDSDTKVASNNGSTRKQTTRTEQSLSSIGMTLSAITPVIRDRFGFDDTVKGVVVTDVDGVGPAAEKGIRPGNVIVEVSQEKVTTPAQVSQKIRDARKSGRKSILLLVEGQGGLRFVAIRIDKG